MPKSERDWHELDRQLDRLLDLATGQREQALLQIEQGDPALGSRLRRLLDGLQHSDQLDAIGSSPVCSEALARLSSLSWGHELGSWTLSRVIGRGGMAEVFEAERDVNGARQRAAIKVMALGLGGVDQVRRFRQETGILARLDDPRLSRLIDAGMAPDGRPWLAMEFVDGEPIDRACDARGLGIEARVQHVIEVAMAVDHAHRQLVVHRDLKPANILLSSDGQVRLLDFGIAKIVSPDDSPHDATAADVRAYTLRYASPEQLAGKPTGVASDVFQLGLLLNLLLTGKRAFAGADDDPLRLLQAMQEGAPAPSRQLATAAATVGERRSGNVARLARQVRGDLDSIVLRALEAAPDARYRGARELADDLQRWLRREPVLARRHTRSYRMGRYLRRHWVGASAATAIAVLLLGYAATITWQSARLTQERNDALQARQRAESIQAFLLQVFGSVDPQQSEHRGESIEEMLAHAVERARTDFPDQPRMAAQLLVDMGTVLLRRSRLDDAERAFRDALALREVALGSDHPETLATLPGLGETLLRQRRWIEAREVLMRHLAAVERRFGPRSDELVRALHALAELETNEGEIETAEQMFVRALSMFDALHPASGMDQDAMAVRAQLVHDQAVNLLRGKRYAEAETLLAQSVPLYRQLFGDADQRTLEARKNLAFALRYLNRRDESRAEMRAVIGDERRLYAGPHWQTAYSLGHLANLSSDEKRFDEAADFWDQARLEAIDALGPSHPWVTIAEFSRARVLIWGERFAEARVLLGPIAEKRDREDDLAQRASVLLGEIDGK